jgi:hypothetical protein
MYLAGPGGLSHDQRPTNYGMGRLLYLAGREGWSCDQPPSNYGKGRLLYLAGPDGPSSIPGWAGRAGHVISLLVVLENPPAGGVVTRPPGMGGNVHWPACA